MLHKKNPKKENIKQMDNKNENREIGNITYLFVGLFIVLIGYLMYFTLFVSSGFINSSYNSRPELLAQKIVRGSILSRNGEVLAKTETASDGTESRIYPYANLFAHAVGYSTHGKTGVESIADFTLLTSNAFIGDRIENDIQGVKNQGDTVITTLDVNIQKTAYDAMGVYQGAIVVMNVKTGEILALLSKPDFDPNQINQIWDEINADSDSSVLLNRATQGLYPPGSTFKIVTALEYLKENDDDVSSYSYDCTGSFQTGDSVISCYHGQSHGHVNFTESFAKSCNSSFANIGMTLDKKEFQKTCEALLFNTELPVPYSYKESYVPITASSDTDELLQTAIGQGKTQVTPIHMALITSAIANDGILMKPYVISSVENADQDIVKSYKSQEYKRLLDEDDAEELQELMAEVVQNGTATKLKDTNGYIAAGKTGSAEYSLVKSESHAWFTGFAPTSDPEIANCNFGRCRFRR
ncbi:MAG TPA: penicillin-binding transpeptidase domain-containing protein [Lachnospiraceae bacterium]|nr:penicillin-binding transpeptidase domain-containing protein [Lachnospiraceae bacterium]